MAEKKFYQDRNENQHFCLGCEEKSLGFQVSKQNHSAPATPFFVPPADPGEKSEYYSISCSTCGVHSFTRFALLFARARAHKLQFRSLLIRLDGFMFGGREFNFSSPWSAPC